MSQGRESSSADRSTGTKIAQGMPEGGGQPAAPDDPTAKIESKAAPQQPLQPPKISRRATATVEDWEDLLGDPKPRRAPRIAHAHANEPEPEKSQADDSDAQATRAGMTLPARENSKTLPRPMMPQLLAPVVSDEVDSAETPGELPMVTSADLDRLARERKSPTPDSTRRTPTLRDLPPVPGFRRPLNRTVLSATGADANDTPRKTTGLHASVPSATLHNVRTTTSSHASVGQRFSPPAMPEQGDRPRSDTLSPFRERVPTLPPFSATANGTLPPVVTSPEGTLPPSMGLFAQDVHGPGFAGAQLSAAENLPPSAAPTAKTEVEENKSDLRPSQAKEALAAAEARVDDAAPPAPHASRTTRIAVLAGSLAAAGVILLAIPLVRNTEPSVANSSESVKQAAPAVAPQPDQLEAKPQVEIAVKAPTLPEKAPAVEPAETTAALAATETGTTEVEDAKTEVDNEIAPEAAEDSQLAAVLPSQEQLPATATPDVFTPIQLTNFPALTLGKTGGRTAPASVSGEAKRAYEQLPAQEDDRQPIGAIAASGLHIDKLTVGAAFVDHRCSQPQLSYSIAQRDRVHVCVRFVHDDTVSEEVVMKWVHDGTTIRRKIMRVGKGSHYGGGYMFLPVASEPGWNGAWTISFEAADGTTLTQVAVEVTD